jgi:hypothetical protein
MEAAMRNILFILTIFFMGLESADLEKRKESRAGEHGRNTLPFRKPIRK